MQSNILFVINISIIFKENLIQKEAENRAMSMLVMKLRFFVCFSDPSLFPLCFGIWMIFLFRGATNESSIMAPGCHMCNLSGLRKQSECSLTVQCSVVAWCRVWLCTVKMTQPGEVLCWDASVIHFLDLPSNGAFLVSEVPLDLKSLMGFLP